MVPGHVTAIGPGLVTGNVDEPANFTILTNDAGNLALAVEGPSKVEIFCKDNQDGTVSVYYLPTARGEYTVTVKFDDKCIPESPFMANIADRIRTMTDINAEIDQNFEIHRIIGLRREIDIKNKNELLKEEVQLLQWKLARALRICERRSLLQYKDFMFASGRKENIEPHKEPVVLNQFVNCNFEGVTKLNMNSGDVNNNQHKVTWMARLDQDGEIHFERNFTDTDHLSQASDWDQKLLRDKLEFHGIPKTKSENLRKTIISLVERLGVRLSDDDIVDCHRVPCRENPLHPIVVANFANFRTRDLIHERRKRFAGVTDFGIEGMTSLFINESFTKKRRGLLYKARQLLKGKVIAFLWTKFGKIWMRKSKDSKKIEVNAETVRAQPQES